MRCAGVKALTVLFIYYGSGNVVMDCGRESTERKMCVHACQGVGVNIGQIKTRLRMTTRDNGS